MISQFDDDWITKGEEHNGSSNIDLLGIIDSATRRKNRKKMKVIMKILMMLKWRLMVLKMILRFRIISI